MLPVTTLTINCSSVALIWFGGLRIDSGQMQVGSLIAFLVYFAQILMAVLMATMTDDGVAAGLGVRRTDHRGAVDDSGGQQSGQSGAAVARGPRSGSARPCVVPLPRRGSRCAAGYFVDRAARHQHRRHRQHRFGKVDAGGADLPVVRRDRRRRPGRRRRRARPRRRRAVVDDRAGAPTRLPVLRDRRRQPAVRQGGRHRRTRCGRRCASRPPTNSCGRTPTACRCASRRAGSTSPADSGSDWRSRGR